MSLRVDRHIAVTMPDGVRLAADVFRPARPGRHPAVLLRTPYDRGNAPSFGTQLNALLLAEAGYVVVTQDVRGRGGSEGTFTPFVDEPADGVATIEWAAGQPWSNGVIAMAGMSYCGYTQVLAARERPEPLRAWIPAFCPLDVRDHWVYEGDAFSLAFNLAWMLGNVVPGRGGTADGRRAMAALDDWPATVRHPADGHPALAGAAAGVPYADWRRLRDDAGWWSSLSGRGAGAHDAAVLVVGGWYDLFAPGTAALHAEIAATGAAPVRQLLMGPWDHSPLPLASAAGDLEFGSAAAIDLPQLQLGWLDHVLRDGDPPLPAAARAFVTGWNAWQDWPSWPPPGREAVLYTASGGALAEGLPDAGADRFEWRADDPTPTVGGRLFPRPRWMRSGPIDQGGRSRRPDVAVYRTPPLADEVLAAGAVRAEVWCDWDTPGAADVSATLVDEAADGRAFNVADGVRRRSRAGDGPMRFDVDLGPVAHVFRRGHRIRLDLAGGSFPRVDRQPAAGTSRRALHHGGTTASRLFLPLPI